MPPGKFPESWIMNHESWGGGAQRVWYVPLFNEASNVNSFFCIIVGTNPSRPSSSIWFRIVVIVQVELHFRSRYYYYYYYYSLGLSVFVGPKVISITIYYLFIYLTKFVVDVVVQMGYVGVHNSSKLKICFKVQIHLYYILAKKNAPCIIVKSTI